MIKFLIIRFSSIGDIVLTTPVVRCLKKQVEESEIHYLTKKTFEPVLKNNPYIDRLWLFEADLNRLITELEDVSFDFIIDLHNNLRSNFVSRKLKIVSFPFKKINIQKWLMVNFKTDHLPEVHIVDRYMETLRFFDVQNDQQGLDYFLSEEDRVFPPAIDLEIPEIFVSLVIGAQHFTKKAPPEKLAAICDGIHAPIVILGGPSDVETAERIAGITTNTSVHNLCGQLSLNQSAYLVNQSEVVVSHDTGLMHIAAAFKKKIVSIWGNTIPKFGMYPYLADPTSRQFEVKGLSCRPCSKLGFTKCPKRHFRCMNDQDEEAIAKAVNDML